MFPELRKDVTASAQKVPCRENNSRFTPPKVSEGWGERTLQSVQREGTDQYLKMILIHKEASISLISNHGCHWRVMLQSSAGK